MTLKPLKDRVVAVVEKPLEKTKSGILLGEAKEKPAYAVVESVGPEAKAVKKGDKIVYKEYSLFLSACSKHWNTTSLIGKLGIFLDFKKSN